MYMDNHKLQIDGAILSVEIFFHISSMTAIQNQIKLQLRRKDFYIIAHSQ